MMWQDYCSLRLSLLAKVAAYIRAVVSACALASINVVNRHWARLVLGWVTV